MYNLKFLNFTKYSVEQYFYFCLLQFSFWMFIFNSLEAKNASLVN